MAMSDSLSSLLALADSHLSKTLLQHSQSQTTNGFNIPKLDGTQSEMGLPYPMKTQFVIPTLTTKRSQTSIILAEQIANTMRNREQQRLQEEEQLSMKKTAEIKEEDDIVIDLMEALRSPNASPLPKKQMDNNNKIHTNTEEPLVYNKQYYPTVDMRLNEMFINCNRQVTKVLKAKVNKKRLTECGRVLCARYKSGSFPYTLDELNIRNDIQRFDFTTPSPDDICKEKEKLLKGPFKYNTFNTMAMFGLE